MQTSLLVHVNEDEIDLVVHIPAVAVNSDLQVYKMLTIPYPIPHEKKDQEDENDVEQDDDENSSWTINHENKLIVANEGRSVYYEITPED